MKKIKEDIKNGNYKKAYLLCGTEQYLKRLYRDKLKTGIISDGDEMNLSCFEGKGIDAAEVIQMAKTLPFFAERRLILIENSEWFQSQGEMADELKELPDSTVLVFVERDVDKRNRLYKAVKEVGYICEMKPLEEKDRKLWVASLLKENGKKITDGGMNRFLDKTGADMQNIRMEMEKLLGYTYERDVITEEDVDAVCTEQTEGKIFQMMDCIASRNSARALALFHDLLMMKEKPTGILFMLVRQFNLLMQVRQMAEARVANAEIAGKLGIPPFAVSKYLNQARGLSKEVLLEAVRFGTDIEEQIKMGQINDQIGVEIMVVKFASL